jgi:hypothetical protein
VFKVININYFNKGFFPNIVDYSNKVYNNDIASILLDSEIKYGSRRTCCFRKLNRRREDK